MGWEQSFLDLDENVIEKEMEEAENNTELKSILEELGIDMESILLNDIFAKWNKYFDRVICEQDFVDFCKTEEKTSQRKIIRELRIHINKFLKRIGKWVIDILNEWIQRDLNIGIYKCWMVSSQQEYDEVIYPFLCWSHCIFLLCSVIISSKKIYDGQDYYKNTISH